ncbi:Radical SAM domain protein [Flexistipes sinusarabici DSM 4947]|uniref:Radical SAM domain protein n=2 Tax=Flexistipes sinusarabici TaxID=2352 RepID=F8E800_FLESM|nr:AmmeMemoRadiSam system radical SAM enzyme [Flexistipes sinusarabici]AEI15068.1 Radical SAM domain protein [Flexistipes sinusarabici DSM 4947]
MDVEAKFYQKLGDSKVQCNLCHHHCRVADGKSGICLIRQNKGGTLYQTSYEEITSINVDPVEKKPLYHFYPGSDILSIGTNGCNLKCPFCQNWQISTQITPRETLKIEQAVDIARRNGTIGIAYTYNEPIIWYEFVLDCMKEFRKGGLKNVLVTNGCINREPLEKLAEFTDAVNVDMKGFSDDFYKWVNGSFSLAKQTIKYLIENNIHTELTNLIIPTKNDDPDEFSSMCQWIADLSPDIPLHISRYFPCYKCNIEQTPPSTMRQLYHIAKEKLNYVYAGNINLTDNNGESTSNTICPSCSTTLIKRTGYSTKSYIKDSRCPECDSLVKAIIC